MVVDQIDNGALYYAFGPGIETALRYLASTELPRIDPGRYELGGGCFALVQGYETAPREEKRWEAHRKYIDVQFIASGAELMGFSECSALRAVEDYSETNDVEFFEGEGSFMRASAGTFVILFPHDAHMPGVAMDQPQPVRKVVVKVPVI